jgi:glycosyltransferase involved in cell wall biosynthesis
MHCYSGYVAFPPPKLPTLVTIHDEPFISLSDPISPAHIKILSDVLSRSQNFMRTLILSRNPYVHSTGSTTSMLIKKRYPKIRSSVIPNPFFETSPPAPTLGREQILKQLGIPDNARIVLIVGSLDYRKAIHKILDASTIIEKSSNIHFIVAGKSPNFIARSYSNNVRKRIALQRNKRFHMIGYADDDTLHNLYSHADVFLSASQSEACNLALNEAASYQLPIITTDVGAARDLFDNEVLFLRRNCNPLEIARAVADYIDKPRVPYKALTVSVWKSAISKLLAFYEDIIGTI